MSHTVSKAEWGESNFMRRVIGHLSGRVWAAVPLARFIDQWDVKAPEVHTVEDKLQ